ncbi:DUF2157 domain-containing protein [Flavobacterium suncheonense]|uniref:DUF2157 domain-containing protein n=1 Tax=Flavobacterium suncheonense GH29-5 = DSM 17707 TaxID=1121899 RepID=A0A0A2MA35_9FLAO|nr:DUF2157 domain-containing protein [Flavobacterium suncheonense]KGO89119.1 hypothetical protein Q764_09435 [Flavobacterium suncheonense GH29-5 = DSM 17707]
MEQFPEHQLQKLVDKGFISEAQHQEVQQYKALGLFSLNTELLFLLYLSVLLFTGGVGTLIYKNIDSIGHIAILAVNFVLMLVCFYFSFKKAKGFSRTEVLFDNPVYDYVVLTGSLLATIFTGYLQFQYGIFGEDFSLVSLFSAILCFAVAYYFDNRTVLSMAITSLIAFAGITLTPKTVFENEMYSNPNLVYFGILIGILLILWVIYSLKENLKAHFYFVYYTFAQHLLGICTIAGLIEDYWFGFLPVLAGSTWFFYRESHKHKATSLFVFSLLYGFIGANIFFIRTLDAIDITDFVVPLIYISPGYVIFCIVMFIRAVRNFNKEKHAGIS